MVLDTVLCVLGCRLEGEKASAVSALEAAHAKALEAAAREREELARRLAAAEGLAAEERRAKEELGRRLEELTRQLDATGKDASATQVGACEADVPV